MALLNGSGDRQTLGPIRAFQIQQQLKREFAMFFALFMTSEADLVDPSANAILEADFILCPICHDQVPQKEQAFLDECFHGFCLNCIRKWTETQKAHPAQASADFRPACPLCKTTYRSIIYDCRDGAFRQAQSRLGYDKQKVETWKTRS